METMNLQQYAEHAAKLPTDVLRGILAIGENHLPTVSTEYREDVKSRLDAVRGIIEARNAQARREAGPHWG